MRLSRRLGLPLAAAAALLGAASRLVAVCGPFNDVSDATFCPFVREIFYLGITTGTTPTTYSPADPVTRLQMAAFLSRTVDGVLRRASPRAIGNKFWRPRSAIHLAMTTIGGAPSNLDCDGSDVWVSDGVLGVVTRVRSSDGRVLAGWNGADGASGIVAAMASVLVAGNLSPGRLYRIDPLMPGGTAITVASNLGGNAYSLAFDGARFWTANAATPGDVSIVTPAAAIPWTVTTVPVGGGSTRPIGILFDGSNVWVTDAGPSPGRLLKLNSSGGVLQTVTVGVSPGLPVFDGNNIWVPDASAVSVVKASNGAILATLTGNGMNNPSVAGFDGERVLVTSTPAGVVSLWKAADLSALGSTVVGDSDSGPAGVCSDGLDFWIAFSGLSTVGRF